MQRKFHTIHLGLTDVEIAWIAGLLEGEGSFGLDDRRAQKYTLSKSPPAPVLQISMTDKDVIKRLAHMGNKSYFTETRKTKAGKSVFKLHVGDRATLSYLLPRLLLLRSTTFGDRSLMGLRRNEEIQKGIDALEAWRIWYEQSGPSEMAKKGPKKKKSMKSTSLL